MDIEILLLCLVMADIANRILSDALSIPQESQGYTKTVEKVVGFGVPLAVFVIIVVVALVLDGIKIRRDKKRSGNSNPRPSATEWASIVIKLCTLFGGGFYFAGDNLKTVVNNKEVATLISPALSVSGVVIFRICTHALRTLQHYCKGRQRLPDNFTHALPTTI